MKTKDELFYCVVDNSIFSDMEYTFSVFCSSFEDYVYLPSKEVKKLKEVFGNPICTLEWGFDEASLDYALNALEELGYVESSRLLNMLNEGELI